MLYDYLNRPVKTATLSREISAPTLAGIRTVWNDTVASGLTPTGLATLLLASYNFVYCMLYEVITESLDVGMAERYAPSTAFPFPIMTRVPNSSEAQRNRIPRKPACRSGYRAALYLVCVSFVV